MQEEIKQEQIQEETVEKKPKKSKAGRVILIILLLILLVIGGLVFWGYRQITKMTEPVDLGVEYTYADYESLVSEIGINVEPEKLCFDCPALAFSNPHEIEVVVTGAQAAAAFDIINEKLSFGKVANTQVRFSQDKGELSTTFTYDGRDYPVYISGNIEKVSDAKISGEVFEVRAGNFKLPAGVGNMVETFFVDLANERLATMGDTFRIDDGGLTSEGLYFEGMVPTMGE